MYGYHMPLGGLMGFLILVVLMIVIFRLFRVEPDKSSARSILDERFAKGEISEEEYQKMKATLKG